MNIVSGILIVSQGPPKVRVCSDAGAAPNPRLPWAVLSTGPLLAHSVGGKCAGSAAEYCCGLEQQRADRLVADAELGRHLPQAAAQTHGHLSRFTLLGGELAATGLQVGVPARAAAWVTLRDLGEEDRAGRENAPAKPIPVASARS